MSLKVGGGVTVPQSDLSTSKVGKVETSKVSTESAQAPEANKATSEANEAKNLELSRAASDAMRDQRAEAALKGEPRPFVKDAGSMMVSHQLNWQVENKGGATGGSGMAGVSGTAEASAAGAPAAGASGAAGAGVGASAAEPTLTVRPGALIPPSIDTSDVSSLDRVVLAGMNLDSIPPGGQITVKGGLSGDGAAAFGVHAGAEVEMSIQRSATNPDQFTFSVGGEGKAGGLAGADSTAVAAGYDADARISGSLGAKVEMTVDLSKRGEATELAGFMAHSMAAGTLPPSLTAAVGALESLPGVDIPGEPVDFIREHVSAVEVSGGAGIDGNLAGTLFGGAAGELNAYLKAGGRVEFNEDGTKTLSANGMIGADFTVKGKGGDALYGAVDLGNVKGELGLQSQLTFDENWRPQNVSHSLLFNGRGAIGVGPGMAGVNVKGEITLDQLAQQNPAAAQRLSEAINLGDPEMFRNVMQNDLINPDNLNSLTLRGEVSGFVSASGDLGFKLKEAGTGIEGKVSGGIEYSLPLANGEFVIDRNGLSVKGGMETGLFRVDGQGSVTYDQMLDGMQQIDPQDLYFFMNPPGL